MISSSYRSKSIGSASPLFLYVLLTLSTILAAYSIPAVRAQGTGGGSGGSGSASSTASTSSSSQSSVSAVPTSSPENPPSSNGTVPNGVLTATLPANFTISPSTPYEMNPVDVIQIENQLPVPIYYTLKNESQTTRELICAQQVEYCSKAGCADRGAVVKDNFCNPDTMASGCSCDTGKSNLVYYYWPVATADCVNRASACTLACAAPQTSVANRLDCAKTCDTVLRRTCGTPGQIAVDYSTSSENDDPNLQYVQGSTGGSAALIRGFGVLSIVLVLFMGGVLSL